MTLQNRAKQFLPFAALKGFEEALAAKERIRVPRPVLSQDALDELNAKLPHVRSGHMISVLYYNDGEYLRLTGIVTEVNRKERWLRIVHTIVPYVDLIRLDYVDDTRVKRVI